ncbi:MAG: Fic family protein [Nitrospira sp.]|nr:Fic family protein [Nitrospira sp.]
MPTVMPAPDPYNTLRNPDQIKRVYERVLHPEFHDVIRRANEVYSHWQEFRYRPIPEGLSHEELWAYIKLGRIVHAKNIPLADKSHKQFSYLTTDFIQRVLHEIDLWSGGNITQESPDPLPGRERYIIRSLMEEAIASSQLEGADTTRKVAKEMLRTGRKPVNKSEQMILNNWHAMQFIRENRRKPLTLEMLSTIHMTLTENTLDHPEEAGTIRTTDDIEVEYKGQVVHVPPPAHGIQESIQGLCKFANEEHKDDRWIHPVVKSIIIHFWLAYTHPFTDGNGRTARALMYWYLMRHDYLLFEYIAISRYIIRAPGQYVRAYLFTETDMADLTYFIIYNLRATRSACEDLKRYIQRKQRETQRSSMLLRKYKGLNLRQKGLVYHAIRHAGSVYTIESHKNIHGVVYQTARADLQGLVDQGLLQKTKAGKEFVFVPSERMVEKLRTAESKLPDE